MNYFKKDEPPKLGPKEIPGAVEENERRISLHKKKMKEIMEDYSDLKFIKVLGAPNIYSSNPYVLQYPSHVQLSNLEDFLYTIRHYNNSKVVLYQEMIQGPIVGPYDTYSCATALYLVDSYPDYNKILCSYTFSTALTRTQTM